jgi:small GTP-binding protein
MTTEYLKIIVFGDGGAGKTSLLNRYINNIFNVNVELTKGVDFFSKKIQMHDKNFEFLIWDFGGQDYYRDLLPSLVSGAHGGILLFDLTRYDSIEKIRDWINVLAIEDIPVLIVGTKDDLLDDQDTSYFDQAIYDIMKELNFFCGYLKTSSKTGKNVKEAFEFIISTIVGKTCEERI